MSGAAFLLHGAASFSWTRFEVHPSVALGCILFAAAYLALIGPLRRRYRLGAAVPALRVTSFMAGVLVMFLSLNGPIHDLSDNYLFSAHMVQHMLLTLVMPPLLLAGLPAWIARPVLARRGGRGVARFLTHPAAAFAVYNVVYIGWHFPGMYNLALEVHALHIGQHLMFIAAAVMMWWPVVSPVPELDRLTSPMKVLYIFAFGIPMSVVAAFVTLATTPLYPWYEAAPRLWGLTPIADQQMAGAIMWVPGMIVYWTAMTVVFLRWAGREERQDAKDLATARA